MCRAHLFKYMICKHFSPNVLWTHCENGLLSAADCPRKRKTYIFVDDLCWRCKDAWRVTTVPQVAADDLLTEWFWCVGREDYSDDFEVESDEWVQEVLPDEGAGKVEAKEKRKSRAQTTRTRR